MIVSALKGGLGNQMFQYAMGYRMAKEHGVVFRTDTSWYAQQAERTYELHHFCIEGLPLSLAEQQAVKPKALRLHPRLGWLTRLLLRRIRYVQEAQFAFDPSILQSPAHSYFEGYWQTEKYFDTVTDAIHRQFQLAVPMTASRQATAALMEPVNAVAVHVRRGDYVTNAAANAHHGTCSPEWYERAMSKMAAAVKDPHFFIFSDDPDWVRTHLAQKGPTHYVDPQTDKRDVEDLHLMARCRHNIIANSSFSWWGAWLNQSPGKRVIAPAKWFANSTMDTRDVIPSSWDKL